MYKIILPGVLRELNEILVQETGLRRDMRKREIMNFKEDTQIRSVLLWKVRQRVHPGT